VLQVSGDELVVGCSGVRQSDAGSVAFDEVQLEGKRRMSAAEFLRGFQVKSGERLGL